MPTLYANNDAGVVFPLSVSKSTNSTGYSVYFNFLTNYAADVISGDTWSMVINNPAGTAFITLSSGSGLTIAGSSIKAALTAAQITSLTTFGGYSYQLKDTTASRTRIQGNFLVNN